MLNITTCIYYVLNKKYGCYFVFGFSFEIFIWNVYIIFNLSLLFVFRMQVCPVCNAEVSDRTNHWHGSLLGLAINFQDTKLAIFTKQLVVKLVKNLQFCWDVKACPCALNHAYFFLMPLTCLLFSKKKEEKCKDPWLK